MDLPLLTSQIMREQMLPVSMKWLDVLISDQYCGGSRSFVANVGGTKLCWVGVLSMTSFAPFQMTSTKLPQRRPDEQTDHNQSSESICSRSNTCIAAAAEGRGQRRANTRRAGGSSGGSSSAFYTLTTSYDQCVRLPRYSKKFCYP